MIHTVNVAQVIDGQKVGAFQLRVFLLCAAVLFVDGFDVQGITYVAPAISREWNLREARSARRSAPGSSASCSAHCSSHRSQTESADGASSFGHASPSASAHC